MQRRNRLSRSKDFDTVYRRGRSTSSRYLVLHCFTRDDEPAETRGQDWLVAEIGEVLQKVRA